MMQAPVPVNPRRRGRSSPATPSDNHSQGVDEASSCSSSQAADSMRPLAPPARKRRRTILDAFQSIHIQNEDEEDADSSQAVADILDGEDVSDSTLDDEDLSQADDRLLSDREEAERRVMLDLVLGPVTKPNPVDQKVAAMVRESIRKASTHPQAPTVHSTASAHRDDMHISRLPSSLDLPPPPPLERSNSLPDMASLASGGSDAMDTN